jgi:hypothetical protein
MTMIIVSKTCIAKLMVATSISKFSVSDDGLNNPDDYSDPSSVRTEGSLPLSTDFPPPMALSLYGPAAVSGPSGLLLYRTVGSGCAPSSNRYSGA